MKVFFRRLRNFQLTRAIITPNQCVPTYLRTKPDYFLICLSVPVCPVSCSVSLSSYLSFLQSRHTSFFLYLSMCVLPKRSLSLTFDVSFHVCLYSVMVYLCPLNRSVSLSFLLPVTIFLKYVPLSISFQSLSPSM